LALEKGKRTADDVALAYNELGLLAGIAGRYEEAEKAFLQSLRLRKKSGDKRGQAAALSNLAIHLRNAGRLKEASDQLRKGLEILGSENPSLRMTMMGNLATFLVELEELEEARDWLDRSMTDNELLQDVWQHACNLGCLGLYELAKNNTGAAQTALSKSLESYRAVGDMQGLLATLEISAFIFLRIGDCETAARLIGGTDKHFLLVGVGRPPGDASRRNEALTVIENSLGKEQAEALYALGAMMTVDEIYDLARSDPGESPGFSI
jgi:tetratricopeptide (TPR) repeat protein